MRTEALLFIVSSALAAFLIGCGGSDSGAATPEEAVRGMLDASEDGDWEEAARYVDIEGTKKTAKEFTATIVEGMPEETRKATEEEMRKIASEKPGSYVLDDMKRETNENDFTYKIIETKEKKDGSAVVVVDITRDGKTEKQEFPVVKVGGVWKVGVSRQHLGSDSMAPDNDDNE